eukprot:2908593-Pleurochrysis_carterae.AAC.3
MKCAFVLAKRGAHPFAHAHARRMHRTHVRATCSRHLAASCGHVAAHALGAGEGQLRTRMSSVASERFGRSVARVHAPPRTSLCATVSNRLQRLHLCVFHLPERAAASGTASSCDSREGSKGAGYHALD